MTALPKITFSDFTVEPGEIDVLTWELAFSNFLINPKLFHRDIAAQENIVNTLSEAVGLGPTSLKTLEGIDAKVMLWRRWLSLRKAEPVANAARAELATQPKVVVFGARRDGLARTRDLLAKEFGAVIVHKGTPSDKVLAVEKRFHKDERCRVLCCEIAGAGAIDLTPAATGIFLEGDWKITNNEQAVLRLWNRRQTRPVEIKFALMANSVDVRIQRALKNATMRLVTGRDEDIFAE
jgi:SNF2 family DNA or RNA helicase